MRLVQTEDHVSTEAETWYGHKPRKASSHQQMEETNDECSPPEPPEGPCSASALLIAQRNCFRACGLLHSDRINEHCVAQQPESTQQQIN